MFELISSSQNNKIKYLKKLYQKKYRKEEGKFILEGFRLVEESILAGAELDYILMSTEFMNKTEGKRIASLAPRDKILLATPAILNKLAATSNPQGIIAVVTERKYNLAELLQQGELILILDRIQDPGNMGTIIRTALAAGAAGIIALKGSVDIYNLKVLRSTMGSIFQLPIITDFDLDELLRLIATYKGKYRFICADLKTENLYHQEDYSGPLFLAVGNEAQGIRPELLSVADRIVKIPILGQIDSLNVAVAAGVLLYRIQEGKNFQKFSV